MSYDWKYCSFYPNNFGASALDRGTITLKPVSYDIKACFA